MKILFFSRLFYPHIGGVEKHVMELSKVLTKKGHTVTVITEAQEDTPLIEQKNGIYIYRIFAGKDEWYKKFRIWVELWKLRRLIKEADVVHCHDVFFWYLPFRVLYLQKPVYTTFHGYESYPVSPKAILIRKISEILCLGNICIGEFIKKWYGTRPTFILYGGVDTLKIASRSRENDRRDKRSGVFIGRLNEQTGILTYIRGFYLIEQKYPDFQLIVVGDGKYRKYIKRRIRVLGWRKDPEKYLVKYRFACVSGYLSILEALATKRLVFAVYDNPLKKDYLEMTPFSDYIIIVKDEFELAEQILYFLNHPKEEKQLVNAGYTWVKRQTWEMVANRYLTLWTKKQI